MDIVCLFKVGISQGLKMIYQGARDGYTIRYIWLIKEAISPRVVLFLYLLERAPSNERIA